MSGVPTDVTVQVADNNTFACTLNMADFFDGGEREGAQVPPDITLTRSEEGGWQITGESKVTLNGQDVESLGNAIDEDYRNQ